MKLWIARDKDGLLRLFGEKPYYAKDKIGWEPIIGSIWLREDIFPEITFENSPRQVELISSEEYNRLKNIEEDWLKRIGYSPNAYD